MSNSYENAKKLGELFNKIPATDRWMMYVADEDSVPTMDVNIEGIPMNIEFDALADYIIQILSELKENEK